MEGRQFSNVSRQYMRRWAHKALSLPHWAILDTETTEQSWVAARMKWYRSASSAGQSYWLVEHPILRTKEEFAEQMAKASRMAYCLIPGSHANAGLHEVTRNPEIQEVYLNS